MCRASAKYKTNTDPLDT